MARPKKQQPYIVAQPFQDAREYMTGPTPNQYSAGDDVSHMDADRLARLVELGIVTGGNVDNSADNQEEAE